jgi:hypothetical protein
MQRFRALAAILACLAVLAGGAMTVAAATVPSGTPATELGTATASAPCSHCDDCDPVPCPMPATSCLHVSSNVTPALITATFDFPGPRFSGLQWPHSTVMLSGLSSPPDPFPPRA